MNKIINKIKNKTIESLKIKEITIQKYKPVFITTDKNKHEGKVYNWCISDRLNCPVPKFLMGFVRENKYIEDESGTMYLLSNVVSIEWVLVEEKIIGDTFPSYKTFITNEELKNN